MFFLWGGGTWGTENLCGGGGGTCPPGPPVATPTPLLKSIQNRAARLVFNVGRTTPTTPLLRELHWLPIAQRIKFKLCLHIHNIIINSAPEYLSNCISLYKPSGTLRSSQDTARLQIPHSNYSFSANRFGVAAPKAWNIIPQHIREMTSTPLF